jgi:hypothetical protein
MQRIYDKHPLLTAIYNGDIQLANKLIDKYVHAKNKIQLYKTDDCGNNALMVAIQLKQIDLSLKMINIYDDYYHKNYNHHTALSLLLSYQHYTDIVLDKIVYMIQIITQSNHNIEKLLPICFDPVEPYCMCHRYDAYNGVFCDNCKLLIKFMWQIDIVTLRPIIMYYLLERDFDIIGIKYNIATFKLHKTPTFYQLMTDKPIHFHLYYTLL